MRKLVVLILSLWVLSTALSLPTPLAVGEDPKGNISFQPNVIPFTTVYKQVNKTSDIEGSGERFRFEWNNPLDDDDPNRFDIELFFNATIYKKHDGVWQNVTRMWSLHDFQTDFECTINFLKNQNESLIQWGWIIDNPNLTNEWLHHGWMRIEDTYPFEVGDIQLETIEPTPEMNFTIKRFHLPDNLVLSFEDLFFKGFMVDVLNQTNIVIMGFEGETHLNLDPITFSSGIMTLTGYSEGSEGNFWEFWNASNVNGWNVAHNNNNSDTQFEFDCRLQIGDGSNTTWFADTNKQIYFPDNVLTASNQWLIRIVGTPPTTNVRLGYLEDETEKTTSQGVEISSGESYAYNYPRLIQGYANLYSCTLKGVSIFHRLYLFQGRIWNCHFEQITVIDSTNVNIYNLNGRTTFWSTTGTFESLFIWESSYAIGGYGAYTVTVENLKARLNTNLLRPYSISQDWFLINVDSDNWNILWTGTSSAEIFRQYTFDLTVTTASNVPIEDANVTLTYYGQGGGTHGTWLTDVNGEIPEQTVTAGFYNQTGGDTIYNPNPYEITITKADYLTYQRNFTQLEAKSWNIALLTEETGYNWFAATIIIGLFACFMTIYALTGKT